MTIATIAVKHERDQGADPGREAEMVPEHHHRVGADADEGAVAEADQAEAPHQRPARVDEAPAGARHRYRQIAAGQCTPRRSQRDFHSGSEQSLAAARTSPR